MFRQGQTLDIPEFASRRSSRFDVEKVIPGGMGVCARIRHPESSEVFALKAIQPGLLKHEGAWKRFEREVHTWVALSGLEGVVPALGVVRLNEIPCVVAQWMSGGDLRAFMNDSEPESYFSAVLRLTTTLAFISEQYGVVHRDLKPGNILFDDDGIAHLADWGIASGVAAAASAGEGTDKGEGSRLTQAGSFLGTVLYAAPEQIIDASSVDWRADLYSLGCILYEWEVGSPPFVGPDAQSVAEQHLRKPVPSLGGLLKKGRFGTAAIVKRCLEKRPEDRYPTYAALVHDLESAAHARGLSISAPEIKAANPQRIVSEDGRWALVELAGQGELMEAEAMVGLGQYGEAAEIFRKYYMEQFLVDVQGWGPPHVLALNLATCLSSADQDQAAALPIFRQLETARDRPAEFFLNYSNALLRAQDVSGAEAIAREGHDRYPEDRELTGNLMSALSSLGKAAEALQLAKVRIGNHRDVNALFDVANALQSAADEVEEDWPAATEYLKYALDLLTEAKTLNSRWPTVRYSRARVLKRLFRFSEAADEAAAVFRFRNAGQLREWAVVLQCQLLWDVRSRDEALKFAHKWQPDLQVHRAKVALDRTRFRILADTAMIGAKDGGRKVVIPEVVHFYETQVNKAGEATADDYIELARVREWMGEPVEALSLIDRCLDLWSFEWRAWMNRSQFLLRLRDLQGAGEAARVAVNGAPYRPEPLDALADVMKAKGRSREAEEIRSQADKVHERRMALAL